MSFMSEITNQSYDSCCCSGCHQNATSADDHVQYGIVRPTVTVNPFFYSITRH